MNLKKILDSKKEDLDSVNTEALKELYNVLYDWDASEHLDKAKAEELAKKAGVSISYSDDDDLDPSFAYIDGEEVDLLGMSESEFFEAVLPKDYESVDFDVWAPKGNPTKYWDDYRTCIAFAHSDVTIATTGSGNPTESLVFEGNVVDLIQDQSAFIPANNYCYINGDTDYVKLIGPDKADVAKFMGCRGTFSNTSKSIAVSEDDKIYM